MDGFVILFFVFIGILTQLNLVQKLAELSISFWKLFDLKVELILKMVNGNEKYIVMITAKEYLSACLQSGPRRVSALP